MLQRPMTVEPQFEASPEPGDLSAAYILGMVKRRALWALIPLCLIGLLGGAVVYYFPSKYVAAGKVLVQSQQIPTDLVDRVEVISVGGAPIYGSDAIAGTVNVILKKNFSGIQLRTQYGVSQHGDGQDYNASALAGQNFADGRGNGGGQQCRSCRRRRSRPCVGCVNRRMGAVVRRHSTRPRHVPRWISVIVARRLGAR